jgi:YD repeat-containing protein
MIAFARHCDANGNRTNTGYSTGTGNEMATGAGYSYQYDANGNRVAQWVNNNGVTETSPQANDTNITIFTCVLVQRPLTTGLTEA